MSWVILSILAALCFAVVNIVDKYVLTNWIKKPIAAVITYGLISLAASLLIYIFHGFAELSYFNIFLALIAGILAMLMAIFYFKAVKIEEISRVMPLFLLSPLFIMVFALIFLGEALRLVEYLGVFMIVLGAILISSRNPFKISLGKSFWFMILSVLSISAHNILLKYLLGFADFWTIFAYIKIGMIFPLVPVLYFGLPTLISVAKKHGKKVIIILGANELLTLAASLLITVALTIGYVTLVKALSSVQLFFVLLFTIILSVFYPKILKEEIKKSVVLIKLAAMVVMFIGVLLII